ncbi:hypothetical protein EVAR_84074_1 [Eumeta japonica]|uniref:Uncharacterized protein n=1 Tax=Eumeta variegata TaxID=151549 RepID=A0A4C1UYT9_EUMVA|nr:hypothetical protein EVAR_84074_1 [Eumeta japonica]
MFHSLVNPRADLTEGGRQCSEDQNPSTIAARIEPRATLDLCGGTRSEMMLLVGMGTGTNAGKLLTLAVVIEGEYSMEKESVHVGE